MMMMIYLISLLLLIQADFTLSKCTEANWRASFDRQGWSVCPDDREFLTGFWRSGKEFRLFQAWGDGLWLLEHGNCCPAIDPRYIGQLVWMRAGVQHWISEYLNLKLRYEEYKKVLG